MWKSPQVDHGEDLPAPEDRRPPVDAFRSRASTWRLPHRGHRNREETRPYLDEEGLDHRQRDGRRSRKVAPSRRRLDLDRAFIASTAF
jgi:hypothetical protein